MSTSTPSCARPIVEALGDGVVLLIGSDTLLGRCLLEHLVALTRVRQVLCVAATPAAGNRQARLAEELSAVGLEQASEAARAAGEPRVVSVPGGYRLPGFGLDASAFVELGQRVDAVVNCAVVVDASACFSEQLRVHVGCVRDAVRLAAVSQVPAAVCHVSSCYAALSADGRVEERIASDDYPARDTLGVEFSAQAEIEDLERLVAELELRSRSQVVTAELTAELRAQGRPRTAARLRSERERWLRRELLAEGERRAQRWGWPSSHAFTRALGERSFAASTAGSRAAIVRHALLGPALQRPEPGWLGGSDLLSPLVFLAERGLRSFPLEPEQTVDIAPVDRVAAVCLAVTALAYVGSASGAYHATGGEQQSVSVARLVELTDLGLRGRAAAPQEQTLVTKLRALGGARAVGKASMAAQLPARLQGFFEGSARWASRLPLSGLSEIAARIGVTSPAAQSALAQAEATLEGVQQQVQSFCEQEAQLTKMVANALASYAPFVTEQRLCIQTRRAAALLASLSDEERSSLKLQAEPFDWQRYWLDVALPGVRRYGFARLGAPSSALSAADAALSPLGLVSRVARRLPGVAAVEVLGDGQARRLTYWQLSRAALELCGRLREAGAGASSDVSLVGEDELSCLVALLAVFELDAGSAKAGGRRVVLVCDARPFQLASELGVALRVDVPEAPGVIAQQLPESLPLLRCAALPIPRAMNAAVRLAELLALRERERVVLVGKLRTNLAFFAGFLHAIAFGATAVLADARGSTAARLAGARVLVLTDDAVAKLWRELEPHVKHAVGPNRQAASALLAISRWCTTELGVQAGRSLFRSVHQQLSDKLELVSCVSHSNERDLRAVDGLVALGLRVHWLDSVPLSCESVRVEPARGARRAKRRSKAPQTARQAKVRTGTERRRSAAGARQ